MNARAICPSCPAFSRTRWRQIVRTGTDGERELIMARWGMLGPPQYRVAGHLHRNLSSPHWRGMARRAKPLHGAGDLVLRIRGHETAQDAPAHHLPNV
jgi:hypothetical protein